MYFLCLGLPCSDVVGANRHSAAAGSSFDKQRCDAFDAQVEAKLRECANALSVLKEETPHNSAVATWEWNTNVNENAAAMHSAAIVASVDSYLDRVAEYHKTLVATRSKSVDTIGRLSLPAPLKPTLRRRAVRRLTDSAEQDQVEDRRAVEEARQLQRHVQRVVEQTKRIEFVVLEPKERKSLQSDLREELADLETELTTAVSGVDKLAARHSRNALGDADTALVEVAGRLCTSLRRDLSQVKSALDHLPRRLQHAEADGSASRRKRGSSSHVASAATVAKLPENNSVVDDHQGSNDNSRNDGTQASRHGPSPLKSSKGSGKGNGKAKPAESRQQTRGPSPLYQSRETRIKSSLQGAVDSTSYSGSLSAAQLETEQQNMMAQKEREDDLTTSLLSARQKLQEIAEQRTKLAQHVVAQNEVLARTLKDTEDAKDDITSGNEEVKQATSSQNDMRYGVVFFLLLCSASLIFLEWEGSRY